MTHLNDHSNHTARERKLHNNESEVLSTLAAAQTFLSEIQDGKRMMPNFTVTERGKFGPEEIKIDNNGDGKTDSIAKVKYNSSGMRKIDIDRGADGDIDSRIFKRNYLLGGSRLEFYRDADEKLTAIGREKSNGPRDLMLRRIEFSSTNKEPIGTISIKYGNHLNPISVRADRLSNGTIDSIARVYRNSHGNIARFGPVSV